MHVKFTHDVFSGGVRIHAQDDVAELDDNVARWVRRGAAVEITIEEPRRGRPPRDPAAAKRVEK